MRFGSDLLSGELTHAVASVRRLELTLQVMDSILGELAPASLIACV